jgi:hypothetical protein
MADLLYSNNADIKYPLSDFHEEDVPNDILLDLSLDVPEGLEPVLSVLRVGAGYCFVSITDKTTKVSIADVLIQKPRLARVYPFDMSVDGFGWVMVGPGAVQGKTYYSDDVSIDLDPEVYTALKQTAHVFSLDINGFSTDLSNFLHMVSGSEILEFTIDGQNIYIDRNDSVLTEADQVAFSEQGNVLADAVDTALFTVDGVEPDAAGNIDINVEGCIDNCPFDKTLPIKRGDTGGGTTEELPLDIFGIRIPVPGDPCVVGVPPTPETPDNFDGCLPMNKQTIADPTNNLSIGTLYTPLEVDAPFDLITLNKITEEGDNKVMENGDNKVPESSL